MKTRSNMPLFVVECEDVKALSNAQIDLLRCGDYLVKKDASGEHAYKVTYKSDTGMCITYYDASVIETQSYDKINGVWTYNSEDKTPNLLELPDEIESVIASTVVGNAEITDHAPFLGTLKIGNNHFNLSTIQYKLVSYARMTLLDGPDTLITNFDIDIDDYMIMTDSNAVNLYVFTYSNCFVIFTLSQTGEGRVPANLVNSQDGSSVLGKLRAYLTSGNLYIETNITNNDLPSANMPTAYLFRLTILNHQ